MRDNRPGSRFARSALPLVGLLLLAVNLRPAAVSVGPILAEISDGVGLGPILTGLLTSLPVIAFAIFGAAAPWLARRFGIHKVALATTACTFTGLALRSQADSPWPFLTLSLLALAGMAAANVLMPSLVRIHFPDRIGNVTALYTTLLAAGLAVAASTTAPITEATGTWRGGLGVWAIFAALAFVPWLLLARRDQHLPEPGSTIRLVEVARTRLGAAMALLFALQSLQAYVLFGWLPQLFRDAGYSSVEAGLLVGVATGVAIPLAMVVPPVMIRYEGSPVPILAVMSGFPIGYLMLLVAPYSLAIPATLALSLGLTTFPLVLTLIGTRSRTASGTATLSAFTQSGGYLLAAPAPFVIGALYHSTGEWSVPLGTLLLICAPMMAISVYVVRSRPLEDVLRR